ncbi:unnamed protein product, partial [Aphanomyces euteiches]
NDLCQVEKLSKQQKKELRERLYLEKEAATQALIMTNPDYPNGVAWANRVSTMWTPVYICDLAKWLIPQGKHLEPIQVYFFGTHEMYCDTCQLRMVYWAVEALEMPQPLGISEQ